MKGHPQTGTYEPDKKLLFFRTMSQKKYCLLDVLGIKEVE